MQISRFDLILYNYHNWAVSCTLISPDGIIFSKDLTCSSVVSFSSCISLNFCSLKSIDGFTVGTYVGTETGSPEESTEGTTGGNIEWLLLSDWLGCLYGLELGTNFGHALVLSYGKVLGTTLGALDGISPDKYDGTVIRCLEGTTEGTAEGRFENLLLSDWFR